MKDWRGNEYDVGDTIIYPAAFGDTLEMAEAEVVGFVTKDDYRGNPQTKVRVKVKRKSRYNEFSPSKTVLITIISNITKVDK